MTDKIIIDGVDVSGCEYFDKNEYYTCTSENTFDCEECPICYYKQLQRKEQECEELKQNNIQLNNKFLREEIKNAELTVKIHNFARANSRQADNANSLGKQMLIYKQALKKIEEILKNGVYDECNIPLDENTVILNIINEVKDANIQS